MKNTCELCGKEFEKLSLHLTNFHRADTEEYYNLYIAESNPICYCGKRKKFRNFTQGYLRYCSHKCYASDPLYKEARSARSKGRKQTEETIRRRIENTDQKAKEAQRKSTMIEKYGVDNCSYLDSVKKIISEKNTGKKSPRSAEHQKKIIDSKRRNGTLAPSEETKKRISKTVRALYASDNAPCTISNSSNKNHKSGHFNGIYYRSSYELKFLEYCNAHEIEVISAENNEFRVPYIDEEGTRRHYYPDFYLPDYDIIIEIKPMSMIDVGLNPIKIDAGAQAHSYALVTEEELDNLDEFFEYL